MGIIILAVVGLGALLAKAGEHPATQPSAPVTDRPTGHPNNAESVMVASNGASVIVTNTEGGPRPQSDAVDIRTGEMHGDGPTAGIKTAPGPTGYALTEIARIKTRGLTPMAVGDAVQSVRALTDVIF